MSDSNKSIENTVLGECMIDEAPTNFCQLACFGALLLLAVHQWKTRRQHGVNHNVRSNQGPTLMSTILAYCTAPILAALQPLSPTAGESDLPMNTASQGDASQDNAGEELCNNEECKTTSSLLEHQEGNDSGIKSPSRQSSVEDSLENSEARESPISSRSSRRSESEFSGLSFSPIRTKFRLYPRLYRKNKPAITVSTTPTASKGRFPGEVASPQPYREALSLGVQPLLDVTIEGSISTTISAHEENDHSPTDLVVVEDSSDNEVENDSTSTPEESDGTDSPTDLVVVETSSNVIENDSTSTPEESDGTDSPTDLVVVENSSNAFESASSTPSDVIENDVNSTPEESDVDDSPTDSATVEVLSSENEASSTSAENDDSPNDSATVEADEAMENEASSTPEQGDHQDSPTGILVEKDFSTENKSSSTGEKACPTSTDVAGAAVGLGKVVNSARDSSKCTTAANSPKSWHQQEKKKKNLKNLEVTNETRMKRLLMQSTEVPPAIVARLLMSPNSDDETTPTGLNHVLEKASLEDIKLSEVSELIEECKEVDVDERCPAVLNSSCKDQKSPSKRATSSLLPSDKQQVTASCVERDVFETKEDENNSFQVELCLSCVEPQPKRGIDRAKMVTQDEAPSAIPKDSAPSSAIDDKEWESKEEIEHKEDEDSSFNDGERKDAPLKARPDLRDGKEPNDAESECKQVEEVICDITNNAVDTVIQRNLATLSSSDDCSCYNDTIMKPYGCDRRTTTSRTNNIICSYGSDSNYVESASVVVSLPSREGSPSSSRDTNMQNLRVSNGQCCDTHGKSRVSNGWWANEVLHFELASWTGQYKCAIVAGTKIQHDVLLNFVVNDPVIRTAHIRSRKRQPYGTLELPMVLDVSNGTALLKLICVGRPLRWPYGIAGRVLNGELEVATMYFRRGDFRLVTRQSVSWFCKQPISLLERVCGGRTIPSSLHLLNNSLSAYSTYSNARDNQHYHVNSSRRSIVRGTSHRSRRKIRTLVPKAIGNLNVLGVKRNQQVQSTSRQAKVQDHEPTTATCVTWEKSATSGAVANLLERKSGLVDNLLGGEEPVRESSALPSTQLSEKNWSQDQSKGCNRNFEEIFDRSRSRVQVKQRNQVELFRQDEETVSSSISNVPLIGSVVESLRCAISESQGPRRTMEDRHVYHMGLKMVELNKLEQRDPSHQILQSAGQVPVCSIFAVFDGHHGAEAAGYVAENLVPKFHERIMRQAGPSLEYDLEQALLETVTMLEDGLLDKSRQSGWRSGCTSVIAAFYRNNLAVSNIGDSRAVLSTRGTVVALTSDQNLKAHNREEISRVESLGGIVSSDGYLNGQLGVSRAFGNYDVETREKMVGLSADPEFTKHSITIEDEFIIIACDGLWDVFTNKEAADFVRWSMKEYDDANLACHDLVQEANARNTTDNVTVMIIALNSRPGFQWLDPEPIPFAPAPQRPRFINSKRKEQ